MELKKYFIKHKSKETIEAEEIFLDSEAVRSLEEKGKMEQAIKPRNFYIFFGLIIVCLCFFLAKIYYLEIIKGEYYQGLALGNRLKIYPILAPRGIIYDRSYQPLVYNVPSFDLNLIFADFYGNQGVVRKDILNKIADILKKPIADLEKEIERSRTKKSSIILVKNIDREQALVLENYISNWPGLRLEQNTRRNYLGSLYFSHLLGYTGQMSEDDLKKHSDYSAISQVGKSGLELFYDKILRGEIGEEQIEIDALGKTQRVLAKKSSVPGNGLLLYLDREFQEKLYDSLAQVLKNLGLKKASAVAINPNNGAVLAMVSLPSFDSNLFSLGIEPKELEELQQSPNQPFLNRATSGLYSSGSIIKPIIAAAALEENIISPNQSVNCAGDIAVANIYNPEIIYRFLDWKVHGPIDMRSAIAWSCNVYFYTIGGGYGNIKGLGLNKINKYLKLFGLGGKTKIDLTQEEAGLVPDEEWKIANKNGEKWNLGDTYHLSIGQGDILATPLQLTMAIAAVANGGTLYTPQIVDKIIDLDKETIKDLPKEIARKNFIAPNNIKVVQEGMRQAVTSGSAQLLNGLPVKTAAKTGTAQFEDNDKTHAWFTAYAPYNNPEIVLTVMIEGGGEGSAVAAPVARDVLQWYFGKK